MCARYVARRRAEIGARDRDGAEGLDGFVPQAREPGAEAEVDFGDVTVELDGQLARCFMFAFRLSYSGKACHRVFASQAQEAFLEGHVTAFETIGGVPSRQIRYDNLSPAVAKVLAGRNRTETQRWLAFRAHYKSVPASSPVSPGSRVAAGSGLTWAHPGIGIDSNIRGGSS
jgi:transposase